jgi:hypothetical protein
MRDIYAYSECNIAAKVAVDSTQGYLFERAERSTDQLWTVKAGPWAKGKEYIILDLHGLVVQERILPPRTPHIGRPQVFWECDEGVAYEFWLDAVPKAFEDSFSSMFRNIQEELHKAQVKPSTTGAANALPVSEYRHPAPTYTLWGPCRGTLYAMQIDQIA